MSAITFSGLASGLDTSAIISSLVQLERVPMQRLQAQNADMRSQMGIFDSLAAALGKLRTTLRELDTSGEFASYKATVTGTAVAATTTGDAVPGSYSLDVTSVARAQRTYSAAFGSASDALAATDQTLTLTIAGEVTNITVKAGDGLDDVVAAINASGAEASAGLAFDGSQYRLQVVGKQTGDVNEIVFTDSGLGLGLEIPANTVQAATDAVIRVDDLFDVTSATNEITGVLPGVTLNVLGTGSADLSVATDPAGVKTKVQGFVDAYNAVMAIVNAQSGKGKGTNTLNGDATLRTIEQGLKSMISSPVPGLVDDDGNDLILADLGISTQRDGTILLDAAKLSTKLGSDFAGTARYFTGLSGIDGMAGALDDLIETYTSGTDPLIPGRKEGLQKRIASNDARITQLEAYLESYEANLRAQFTQLEEAMSAIQTQGQYLARFLQQGG
jgi:flagellar hook-associated protein 2